MKKGMRAGLGALAAVAALGAGIAQPAGAVVDEVVPPILTTPCKVITDGVIIAANGDRAVFSGEASTRREELGTQRYRDRGPATDIRFRSVTMTGLFCNQDARQADMVGTGVVTLASGEQEVVEYRISVRDLGDRPTSPPDTYRITLSNGYDSGDQPLFQGDIRIRYF